MTHRSGAGSHYGTFSGPVKTFSPVSKQKNGYASPGRNFITNPSRKGTGYGYVNVLIGKAQQYASEPYDRARETRRVSFKLFLYKFITTSQDKLVSSYHSSSADFANPSWCCLRFTKIKKNNRISMGSWYRNPGVNFKKISSSMWREYKFFSGKTQYNYILIIARYNLLFKSHFLRDMDKITSF